MTSLINTAINLRSLFSAPFTKCFFSITVGRASFIASERPTVTYLNNDKCCYESLRFRYPINTYLKIF